jgi:virulence-associated protein VagC
MTGCVAEVIQNGTSQAIQLPRQLRLVCKEVFISQEENYFIVKPITPQFSSKDEIVDFLEKVHEPNFELHRDNSLSQTRDIF